ncbi:MAG: InlB B-repeat-containing protein, partial [Verrucomicrobiota bacterium]|nr:InlB B-repeat-containing protein [Verrucomicrobiota bacterium]
DEAETVNLTVLFTSGGTVSNTLVTTETDVPVTVTASPDTGYTFRHWIIIDGSAVIENSNLAVTSVTLSDDAEIKAVFYKETEGKNIVTLQTEEGGTVNPASGTYYLSDYATLTLQATPNENYVFSGWSITGSGTIENPGSPSTKLTAQENVIVTACFTEQIENVVLILKSEEGGSINPGRGIYTLGKYTRKVLNAIPQEGYVFAGWKVENNATLDDQMNPQTTATIIGDSTITAQFNPAETKVLLTMAVTGVDADDTNPQANTGGNVNPGTGNHEVLPGESVSIEALPIENYEFLNWSITGNGCIDNSKLTKTQVTLDDNASVTAWFRANPTLSSLTLNTTAGGTVNPGVGLHTLARGSSMQITAIPDDGYHFSCWIATGKAILYSSYEIQTNVVVSGESTVTAHFAENVQQRTLMVFANFNGSTNPGEGEYRVEEGELMQVEALPETGYHFTRWSISGSVEIDDLQSPKASFVLYSDATVQPVFEEDISVVLQIDSMLYEDYQESRSSRTTTGGTTNPGNGSYDVSLGSQVNLEAISNPGYYFVEWVADSENVNIADAHAQQTTVILHEATSVLALFGSKTTSIDLTIEVLGNGNTSYSLGTHSVNVGEPLSVTAVPGNGSYFKSWQLVSGNAEISSSSETEIYITPGNQNSTIKAMFTELPPETWELTTSLTPENRGSISIGTGTRTLYQNVPLPVTAIPAEGYSFYEWQTTGGATVQEINDKNTSVTLTDANGTLIAVFTTDNLLGRINDMISDKVVDEDEIVELEGILLELVSDGQPEVNHELMDAYAEELVKMDEILSEEVVIEIIKSVNSGLKTVVLSVYNGWNLISTPYRNCIPEVLFVGKYAGSIFRYNNDSYELHDKTQELISGYAYWIYLKNLAEEGITQIVLSGTDIPEKVKNLPISTGWNLFGPFDVPEENRKIEDMNYVEGRLFSWNALNSIYVLVGGENAIFELGKGYWGYVIDSSNVTDMALVGDKPFILNFNDKTVRVNLTKTTKGDFSHVKMALFDITAQESVMQPVVLTKQSDGDLSYVKGYADSLISEHEYFIELAPIRNNILGIVYRTSFYAIDTDDDGTEEVPEYQNPIIRNATAEWGLDKCDITIPNSLGKYLEIKIDKKVAENSFENHSKYVKGMTDYTISVKLDDLNDVEECIISIRFVDSAGDDAIALSGWKSFTGVWSQTNNKWQFPNNN